MNRLATLACLVLVIGLGSSSGAFAGVLGAQTTNLLFVPIPTVMPYGDWEYGVRATLGSDLAKGRFFDNSLIFSPAKKLEFGATWNLNRPVGPFRWGVKYQILDNQRQRDFISLSAGINNNTGITGPRHSDAMGYITASRDLGDKLTAYIGYMHFDGGDNDVYGGANWRWNDRWQVRGEWLEQDNNREHIASAGVRYRWIKHVDLSGWVTDNSVTNDTTVTVEFALHGDLRNLTTDDNTNPDRITY